MRVLVTGATGVYGRSLVDRLHRAGHEVVAMARNPPKALPPGVRFAQGDVADPVAVAAAMEGCEVVAHLAFVVSPLKSESDTRKINLGGTQNVLDAMRAHGTRRLVFASSAMSYGANPDNPPLFTEEHEQRPAPDYVYGTHKKAAEQLIRDSGVEAVMARTAVTVGRNIDNLLVDIFAAPAIVGIKGIDVRYQLVHQDDIGRFLALACVEGPPGPVNVAPSDFLSLRDIAQILGKRYVELPQERVLQATRFLWEHDLVDITPGEASGISYLPRMATDRLREEWGFECAWTTAEGVLDLRRATGGTIAMAKRRVAVPGRLRYPTQRPGEIRVGDGQTARPATPAEPGELDTPATLAHPGHRAALTSRATLTALTLDVHAYLLRAACTGLLDAVGVPEDERLQLGAAGAGTFAHQLYVNTDIVARTAEAPAWRRRVLAARYPGEVRSLVAGMASTFARAATMHEQSDAQLDATLGVVRDGLAWLWAAIATGAVLDGGDLPTWDVLITDLPSGVPLAVPEPAIGTPTRCGAALVPARRTALMLGQTLGACVRERAARLAASGVLADTDSAAHLTWEELLEPPCDLAEVVERRRAEHDRLLDVRLPELISVVGPASAVHLPTTPKETLTA